MDIQKQHLCPRLVDYLTIVGAKPYTSGKGLAPVQVTMFFSSRRVLHMDYVKIIIIIIIFLNTVSTYLVTISYFYFGNHFFTNIYELISIMI